MTTKKTWVNVVIILHSARGRATILQYFFDFHDMTGIKRLRAAMLFSKCMLSQSKTYGANISSNLDFKYGKSVNIEIGAHELIISSLLCTGFLFDEFTAS